MDFRTKFLPCATPLSSRLDRLNFLMKFLERKQRTMKKAETQKEKVETLALKQATQASLLDRISTLENRIIQVCLEMESNAMLDPGSEAIESMRSRCGGGGEDSSYPVFTIPSHPKIQPPSTTSEIQEVSSVPLHLQVHGGGKKTMKKRTGGAYNNNKGRNSNKPTPPRWPHLKLLGC